MEGVELNNQISQSSSYKLHIIMTFINISPLSNRFIYFFNNKKTHLLDDDITEFNNEMALTHKCSYFDIVQLL